METKYRLLILILGIILNISLASAVSFSAPSEIEFNSNFNLVILGEGFYALEIIIPSQFIIISDSSGGTRTGNIYKTVTIGNLNIQLRGTHSGTYTISGQYTLGDGIKDLNPQIITVKKPQSISLPTCPTCPADLEWSNCENGQQIKIIYICSSSTKHQCIQTTRTLNCQTDSITDSDNNIITCEVGWICKDKNNLAYQSSDCSLSSIQECLEGCENKECKVKPEIREEHSEENLTIEISPPSTKETFQSFFARIKNFFKKIIEFLIFWD